MKLKEIYNHEKPIISLEIFPPKGEIPEIQDKIKILFEELKVLSAFNPSFISVTYGAGGSTRDKTLELVLKIKKELDIIPVPHFTCVSSTKAEVVEFLKLFQNSGIKNILALRGDIPKNVENFIPPEDGFKHANELVEFINSNSELGIAVAGYPEKHPEAISLEKDIDNLKRKVDAGADIILTQLFYHNDLFFKFVDKAQKAGINIPIVPGILPTTSFSQIQKIPSLCACTLPNDLVKQLSKFQHDKDSMKKIGIEFATKQCQELLKNKVPGIHFYTFNKSFAIKSILEEVLKKEIKAV